MIVLGIETATKVCGVGLVKDGDIILDYQIHRGYVHAEKLPEVISRVFGDAGIAGEDLDGIAVSIGPGSFTGLRIGLGLAKGLAFGLNKPLIAVPTMEGLLSQIPDICEWACVMIQARKGEIFQGLYKWNQKGWHLHEDYQIIPEKTIAVGLPSQEIVFIGDGALQYQDIILKRRNRVKFVSTFLSTVSGYGVAQKGFELLMSGQTADRDALVPIYLKRFQGVA
jgi:tRNA threonylcarbamoyladenosine biosynthesis protein TsaB